MELIEQIRAKIFGGEFEFSQHVVDQSIVRRIGVQEIREGMANGEVIEDYPNDKYGESCWVLGFTDAGRPLHIQCSYPLRPLITLYEPDSERCREYRTRRS